MIAHRHPPWFGYGLVRPDRVGPSPCQAQRVCPKPQTPSPGPQAPDPKPRTPNPGPKPPTSLRRTSKISRFLSLPAFFCVDFWISKVFPGIVVVSARSQHWKIPHNADFGSQENLSNPGRLRRAAGISQDVHRTPNVFSRHFSKSKRAETTAIPRKTLEIQKKHKRGSGGKKKREILAPTRTAPQQDCSWTPSPLPPLPGPFNPQNPHPPGPGPLSGPNSALLEWSCPARSRPVAQAIVNGVGTASDVASIARMQDVGVEMDSFGRRVQTSTHQRRAGAQPTKVFINSVPPPEVPRGAERGALFVPSGYFQQDARTPLCIFVHLFFPCWTRNQKWVCPVLKGRFSTFSKVKIASQVNIVSVFFGENVAGLWWGCALFWPIPLLANFWWFNGKKGKSKNSKKKTEKKRVEINKGVKNEKKKKAEIRREKKRKNRKKRTEAGPKE